MYFFLLTTAILISSVLGNKLAVTFDAADSTCLAECSSCSTISTEDGSVDSNTISTEILNRTVANSIAIQKNNKQLAEIIKLLASINSTVKATQETTENMLGQVEELVQQHNESSLSAPAASTISTSCKEVKMKDPSSTSGTYEIQDTSGKSKMVYCSFETLCESDAGWTRVAHLDMSESSATCPPQLREYSKGSLRVCGRQIASSGSCNSITFPTDINYSEVCGRVTGYQNGQTGALGDKGSGLLPDDINTFYMDGVSITRGNPRKHVWTFMAGNSEDHLRVHDCPCNKNNKAVTVPSFIGNDYFCESSWPTFANEWTFIVSDPLWDNNQTHCQKYRESDCCKGFPWFHKVLGTSTNDDLEFRLCSNDGTQVDSPVSLYELYIK